MNEGGEGKEEENEEASFGTFEPFQWLQRTSSSPRQSKEEAKRETKMPKQEEGKGGSRTHVGVVQVVVATLQSDTQGKKKMERENTTRRERRRERVEQMAKQHSTYFGLVLVVVATLPRDELALLLAVITLPEAKKNNRGGGGGRDAEEGQNEMKQERKETRNEKSNKKAEEKSSVLLLLSLFSSAADSLSWLSLTTLPNRKVNTGSTIRRENEAVLHDPLPDPAFLCHPRFPTLCVHFLSLPRRKNGINPDGGFRSAPRASSPLPSSLHRVFQH